jgi:alpha-galactosidase
MLFLLTLLAQSPTAFPLADAEVQNVVQTFGTARRDRSFGGNPLTVAGTVYPRGIGTHAPGEIWVQLDGNGLRFRSLVGVDAEEKGKGSVRFHVWADAKKVASSPLMRAGTPAFAFDVDLKGVKLLRLTCDDGGDNTYSDHANWLDPMVILKDPTVRPKILAFEAGIDLPVAPVDSITTRLNGPRIVGATPGRDFLFRIPASGRRSMTFTAKGLPKGLTLDRETGIIRGRIERAGETDVQVSVSGPGGRDSRTLRISAGKGRLALTPPMGWNSWNVWGTGVTADRVRAAADAMHRNGLADFGYGYLNIDDGWESPTRNPDGSIGTNEKFGDMKALASYAHSLGLKIGIYSSPGDRTCGGYLGSLGHEVQDAKTYAEWGIDYLKYDWCSYSQVAPNPDLEAMQKPYRKMADALEASGRDIVYSICQYGMGDVWKWGKSVGGALWRTTGDIEDNWGNVSSIGFTQSEPSKYAQPGGWNDPDMLVVGRVGWGSPHPSRLTHNEQITHVTLWSLLAAPLIVGCDLTALDPFTSSLLMNPEVIDIDQDPLGKAATRVSESIGAEVWRRPLAGGGVAVGLFNRGIRTVEVSIDAKKIGVRKGSRVRNVWTRKDEGKAGDVIARTVPPHGAIFLRIE